ncbi:MAG: hypothetical protein GXP21_05705 [Gammaproteobacteria bacterium]|nr:hypothetical protein [Gammaproteobacteria bacterium]
MLKLFYMVLLSLFMAACTSTPNNLNNDDHYKLSLQAKYGKGKAIEIEISPNASDKSAFIDGARVGYIQSWNKLTLERRLTLKKELENQRDNKSLKHNNKLWRRYGSILENNKIENYISKYNDPDMETGSYHSFMNGRSTGVHLAAHDIVKIRQKEIE